MKAEAGGVAFLGVGCEPLTTSQGGGERCKLPGQALAQIDIHTIFDL